VRFEDALLPPFALALGVAAEASAASSLYRSHKVHRKMISSMIVPMRCKETFIEDKKLKMVSGGVVFAFGEFAEGVDSFDDWSVLVEFWLLINCLLLLMVVVRRGQRGRINGE
jgi:hypothetical protein